jgi:hypothetical protein
LCTSGGDSIIAANTILIGIHLQHILRPIQIVLQAFIERVQIPRNFVAPPCPEGIMPQSGLHEQKHLYE